MLNNHPIIADALLILVRPILRIHLALYRRKMLQAPFPRGHADRHIPGPHPDRVLFIGDITVAGYGVLEHGMTSNTLIAGAAAALRGRGITWDTIAAPELALATVAQHTPLPIADTNAVVVMLGIPNVLLGTRTRAWTADLQQLIARIRHGANERCGIVIAAIPPMAEFQRTSPFARDLISSQVTRLNQASANVAADLPGVSFVPFPSWRMGSIFLRDTMSWAAMHRLWANEISPPSLLPLTLMPNRTSPFSWGLNRLKPLSLCESVGHTPTCTSYTGRKSSWGPSSRVRVARRVPASTRP